MFKVLDQKFFQRPAEKVAEKLLGKFLVRKISEKIFAVRISELEIYDGLEDRASHAFRGKTKRNKIMFKQGGYFYIYLVYGMHWMINIVVGKKNHPSALLLREGELSFSNSHELENDTSKVLLNGPERLSRFLKVDKKFNKKKAEPKNSLWFEDGGEKIKKFKKTCRIGVQYAGPIWSKKKLRFLAR